MPPILSTAPRSPDLVRNECSSQNPNRLICAGNEPASFQSFVMCSTLTIAPRNAYLCVVGFHGVVASAEFAGVEEHAQDLHVVLRGDAGDDDARDEEHNATDQRVHEGEDRASGNQRDEEEPSLRAKHGQRTVHRFVNSFLSRTVRCHARPPSYRCFVLWLGLPPKVYDGKSQAIKFTADTAMPMPKTIPASIFFDWPSP